MRHSTTDPLGLKNCPQGFHPLTPAEGLAVVAAAQQIAAETGWKYGEDPALETQVPGTPLNPTEIDCTHFVELAIESAGLVVPDYQTTGEIANGTDYLPASGPAPGGVLLLNAGAGPLSHALLDAGGGAFYGSNSPTKRNPLGGPQPVSPSAETAKHWPWWQSRIAAGKYFIPCVKPLAPPPPVGMGSGGLQLQAAGPGDASEFDFLEQLASQLHASVTGYQTLYFDWYINVQP